MNAYDSSTNIKKKKLLLKLCSSITIRSIFKYSESVKIDDCFHYNLKNLWIQGISFVTKLKLVCSCLQKLSNEHFEWETQFPISKRGRVVTVPLRNTHLQCDIVTKRGRTELHENSPWQVSFCFFNITQSWAMLSGLNSKVISKGKCSVLLSTLQSQAVLLV